MERCLTEVVLSVLVLADDQVVVKVQKGADAFTKSSGLEVLGIVFRYFPEVKVDSEKLKEGRLK